MSLPSSFVVGSSYNHGPNAYSSPDLPSMSGVPSFTPSFIPSADLQPSLSPSTLASVRDSPPTPQEYIPYYFEHTRQLQFAFAGNALTETLYFVRASIECSTDFDQSLRTTVTDLRSSRLSHKELLLMPSRPWLPTTPSELTKLRTVLTVDK